MARSKGARPTESVHHKPKNNQPHLAQELLDMGESIDGVGYLTYHLRRPHREALLGTSKRRRRA